MSFAILLLGSNEGDRLSLIEQAILQLQAHPNITLAKVSKYYETAAWGKEDLPPHINVAVQVCTALEPEALLDYVQKIELELGRVRQVKWGIRTMDIDIIYYDDLVIASERLSVPHAWMQARKFVLVPINDIAPTLLHPIYKISNAALLAQCEDNLTVNPLQLI